MINLFKNEFAKLFKRLIVWLLISLAVLASLGYAYIAWSSQEEIQDPDSGWREALSGEIEDLESNLHNLSLSLSEIEKDEIYRQLFADKFRLDHQISPSDWRYYVVFEYARVAVSKDADLSTTASELKRILLEDDWQTYKKTKDIETRKILSEYSITSYQYREAQVILAENETRYQFNIKPMAGEWKNQLIQELTENRLILIRGEMFFAEEQYYISGAQIENLHNRNTIITYRLENNYPEVKRKTLPFFMNAAFDLTVLISVFMIVLTALSFTNEYAFGTILQLFLYPYKRYKIFLAKIYVLMVTAIGMLLILYMISILFGSLFFGIEKISPFLFLNKGKVYEINYYIYILIKYILCFIEIAVYISLAATISILTKNAGITIGLVSLPSLMAKPVLRMLTINYKINDLNYVPFAAYDLNQFLDKQLIVSNLTLPFALVVIVLTLVILNSVTLTQIKNNDL